MNPKGYKFEVQIYIEKMEMKSSLSFQVQVILKCGNQKVQAQQLADFNQGKAIINETLCIQTNVYQINGTYQEKKVELLILLITTKSNKKAGQCYINIAELLNQGKYDINQELLLQNCPDNKAKIYSKIQLTEVGKVDLEAINTQSSIIKEQNQDKKQGIFTPFKSALENTAKKYFGDSQSAQSQKLENSLSRNQIKNPFVTDISSQLTSQKQKQNLYPVNQVQQDLQHLHEELNQYKILYMEINDQNTKLKQEIQIEKVKKESLILQVQEQRQQIEKRIDQHIYQEQIYQYEQQLSQIQSQLRQAQKDNENLMQQYNKLSEEYNQQQQKINSKEESPPSLKYKVKELEDICNQKDQLYQALEKSNNDSQLRNINFENQIIQLNQQLLQLKTQFDEKDILIKSQTENLVSLNNQLLNLKNYNSSLQQNQQMLNDKIDEQSKQILNQQEQINQQTTEIKQQYEDLLYQNHQTIQQLNKELNQKYIELKSYQTTCLQLKQKNQLEIDDFLKQIEKSKQEGEQIQTDLDLKYREKEQKFQDELQKYHEREEELRTKVQYLLQSTNQLQQLLNDSISQTEVMKKLFLDPQIPSTQVDLPNQLIELNRTIALKFSKLKQDLEFHQSQIQNQEKLSLITLELPQAKLKIDNLQNENIYLQQQLTTKSESLNNQNQLILNQNKKIQDLEIQNKEIQQKLISESQIHHQLSEQIKVFDHLNQDLQIQIKILQIEILQKEDLIKNVSSKIKQLNEQNQEQIIINEQLQFQIKEQIHNAQQLQQKYQISQTGQDQNYNDLILELNKKLKDLEIINKQLQDQIYQKENQIEKLQKDLLQQQVCLIEKQQLMSLPNDQEIEDQSKKEQNNHSVSNLLSSLLIEESSKSQEKQLILEQQIGQLTIQLNQQNQITIDQIKNEYNQILEKGQLSETEFKLQLGESYILNDNLQTEFNSQRIQLQILQEQIQQKNKKIEELGTRIKEIQLQFQNDIQELQQQLFTENDEWQKEKDIIQQYIDELEHRALDLTNQIKEKDNKLQDVWIQNEVLSEQLVGLQQINERAQKLEQQCLDNIQQYEQQQQKSQEDQIKLLNQKKQLNEQEYKIDIQIQQIINNYVNQLRDKDDFIQNLQLEIQNYQQVKQEQQNQINFLENIKDNLERINEKMLVQTQQQEYQINQLQNAIKQLELKHQELETEKINISNNYQQALIEAQSLNHTQDNSNEIIEKIQEEVILLKCRIGDILNEAYEFGGTQLVDKLQQAFGIKE